MEKGQIIKPIIVVICIYLIVTTIQGSVEFLSSGDKLTRRERELATLQRENQVLKVKNKQAESVGFLEEIAYDKLGLSRPSEDVVIIPKELLADNSKPVVRNEEPNWKKWARLLF